MASNQQQQQQPKQQQPPQQQAPAAPAPQLLAAAAPMLMNPAALAAASVGFSMMSNAPYLGMPPEAFAAVAAASMPSTSQQHPAVAQLPTLFPNPAAVAAPQAQLQQQQTQQQTNSLFHMDGTVANVSSSNNNNATLAPVAPQSSNIAANTNNALHKKRPCDLTADERAQQNRDRNREHARSTRLRKKAYVQKLRELVEGLHAERTEEVRRRRVAIQHLAEMQNVRRTVVQSFLEYHGQFETEDRRWSTILEDDFFLQQPVTPYRSFRRAEIEKECRISRGITSMINDSASLAVMVEGIGSRSARWLQLKRDDFWSTYEKQSNMLTCVARQESRLKHGMSSLSSSYGSSGAPNDTSSEEDRKRKSTSVHQPSSSQPSSSVQNTKAAPVAAVGQARSATTDLNKTDNGSTANKVSSSSGTGSSNESSTSRSNNTDNKNDAAVAQLPPPSSPPEEGLHDYHAKPLPDPKLPDNDSPSEESSSSVNNGKPAAADSSDDTILTNHEEDEINEEPARKRFKMADDEDVDEDEEKRSADRAASHYHSSSSASAPGGAQHSLHSRTRNSLPPNIAKTGGIPHNIQPANVAASSATSATSLSNGRARLNTTAPAITLPPFGGLGGGKKAQQPQPTVSARPAENVSILQPAAGPVEVPTGTVDAPAVIGDNDTSSSSNNSLSKNPPILAYYHINEDDMILMEDCLMCPFVFRSQDAVLNGALAECVMPGMLRAQFSTRNKLKSVEMVYDAMGFMQQLERASGSEGSFQIIPGSLEMALAPSTSEARVITTAQAPFQIVNVNDVWTRTTGYTQMDAEGREYLSLLQGEGSVNPQKRSGRPVWDLSLVASGQPACTTDIHYQKDGADFLEFVCSYPLTNAANQITHLLHVHKELASA